LTNYRKQSLFINGNNIEYLDTSYHIKTTPKLLSNYLLSFHALMYSKFDNFTHTIAKALVSR